MITATPFNLSTYLSEKFPSLSLGGGLFYRWPLSIRFGLGADAFEERTAKLYKSIFSEKDSCVLISQDYPQDTMSPVAARRYFSLFSLPTIFDQIDIGTPQRFEQSDSDDGQSILQSVQLPAHSFPIRAIFDGIANADHAKTPSVSSRVHLLNPKTDVLLHMYDDRGLDIIAAKPQPLIRIRSEFSDWVLDSRVENHG